MVLIGGQPGIGKSTLLLQIALGVNAKVLYVSGEDCGNWSLEINSWSTQANPTPGDSDDDSN